MGRAQQEVTLPENPKGAFLPCAVNGVKSQASLDTGAEATIISEDLYSCCKTPIKLKPTQKPVLAANNMPLDVVGKTEVTIQLGRIRAQHKVCAGTSGHVFGKRFCWSLPDGSDCKRGSNPSSCVQLPQQTPQTLQMQ